MKKCVDLLNTKEYSLLIDTTFKHNDLPNVNPKCVVPENIHSPLPSPPRRAIKLVLPPPRWNFLSRGTCHMSFPPPPPHPLEFPVIFQLGWVPSRKNICVKNVVALYYYTKDNFFCDKMRKNLFIYVGRVSNKLKDVIS